MFDWLNRQRRLTADRPTPRCSFCKKSYLFAGPLVEGHGNTYICRDCVRLCGEIIDRELKREGSATRN